MDKLLHEFIPNLQCPQSELPLKAMDQTTMNFINNKIQKQKLFYADGKVVQNQLMDGLISEDNQWAYPVFDGNIAALVDAMAINLQDDTSNLGRNSLSEAKQSVKEFYDQYGWQKSDQDQFRDTEAFEDQRAVAADYWSSCHLRLCQYMQSGDYLLDVASGAIPNPEYFRYADNYKLRVCMDISLLALKQASLRLGGKGIFIMGDMTNLPLKDNLIDTVISMHTVYHIPEKEQTRAIGEAYRVLKDQGKAVIVYSWKDAALMRRANSIKNFLLKLKGKPKKRIISSEKKNIEQKPALFVNQQNYHWFNTEIRSTYHARLEVYSAISRSFSQTFIRGNKLGNWLGKIIFRAENLLPNFFGRYGQYPVFLIHKKHQEVQKTVNFFNNKPKAFSN
jgi:ubiquinone/menaquinone biosynthesis C-methylase UbiE